MGERQSLFVGSISGSVLLAVALTSASFAQNVGVSGIPPGPANGWNSRNPSFNLPQMLPPIPPPTIKPVMPPTAAPLNNSTVGLGQGSYRVPAVRVQPLSSRDNAVRDNDQLLDREITICRGC
jgi:hypothetical protein